MGLLDALFPSVAEDFPNPNAKLLPSCLELSKEKRVVIVGGGPAGVHMSACLATKGFKHVTLLEAEVEVGGKSLTVIDPSQPDVPHELGTCYMSPSYELIRKLLKEYDPTNEESTFANENKGRMVFGMNLSDEDKRKYTKGMEYFDWVLEEVEMKTTSKCCRCLPNSAQSVPIFAALIKYNKLHDSIFGKFPYGMPPKPKDWSKIDMTAMEFLKKNGLEILEPVFLYTQQVQGYGLLDKIPAFYLLWWHHPDVMNGTIRSMLGSDELLVSLLKNGYQSLWKKMVERHSKEVNYITGAQVTGVKRTPTVEVKYMHEGAEKTLEADIFISAIDLRRFRHLITDLDPEEEKLFSRLTASSLTTTLYKGKTTEHEHTVEFWFGKMGNPVSPPGSTGHPVAQFYGHRNSRMAARPSIPSNGVELRVAYQYMDRPIESGDASKLVTTLEENLKTYAGEEKVDVLIQKPWDYFPRFDAKGLREGLPWKILDLQGQRNTVFIGSSVCFESALDVVAYNLMLCKKICA
ncbi:unnamed protein product [Durusdinium trenchii]|uniref:Amine oxidase domain-containing protein n=1 Tax=Durusdinium trenchii TaxID=1381693 RepID=A0ABP0J544_9DINO